MVFNWLAILVRSYKCCQAFWSSKELYLLLNIGVLKCVSAGKSVLCTHVAPTVSKIVVMAKLLKQFSCDEIILLLLLELTSG